MFPKPDKPVEDVKPEVPGTPTHPRGLQQTLRHDALLRAVVRPLCTLPAEG